MYIILCWWEAIKPFWIWIWIWIWKLYSDQKFWSAVLIRAMKNAILGSIWWPMTWSTRWDWSFYAVQYNLYWTVFQKLSNIVFREGTIIVQSRVANPALWLADCYIVDDIYLFILSNICPVSEYNGAIKPPSAQCCCNAHICVLWSIQLCHWGNLHDIMILLFFVHACRHIYSDKLSNTWNIEILNS